MPTLQLFGILGTELPAPQTNGFMADGNTALSEIFFDVSIVEVESMVEPDGILNDFSGKPVAFAYVF